jgi:hypothetical protein
MLDGAQVEVELGERANVDLVGIIGPMGPTGPMGPPGGPMAGYFTPQQFGAVGDGVHDDTAGVQAAINAAGTANTTGHGGVVYFGPGTYKCSQQLKYWAGTEWRGAGAGASVIKLTTDLWDSVSATPAHFVVAGGTLPQGNGFKMSDLVIRGPGAGATPGQVRSHTTGVQSASGIILSNVFIGGGFFAGLEVISNHEKFHNVYSTGNYFNLDYADPSATVGNQAYFSCNFTGAGLASIHIGAANRMEATTVEQCHLGDGPVGILRTDHQNGWDGSGNPIYTGGAAASTVAILASTLSDLAFESIGNAAILDMSSGAGIATMSGGTRIFGEQPFSWSPAMLTTNAPLNNPAYQAAWTLILRGPANNARLEHLVSTAPPAGGLGVLNMTVTNFGPPVCVFNTVPPVNFYGSGVAANWTAPHGARARFVAQYGNALAGQATGTAYGNAHGMNATTVINAGDLVELSAANGTVQRATGTKPVFGVALTPAPGGLTAMVVVLTDGIAMMNAAVASIGPGQILYLDSTTTYLATNVTTSNKIIGVSTGLPVTPTVTGELRFGVA